MRTSLILAATVLAFGLAQAGSAADPDPKNAETVSGKVTKVDPDHNRVTIHSSDGSVHEFEASRETLDELKVGDRIEARKRPGSN